VASNPYLSEGGSAKFILNEVVDGKTSNIAGLLEVVGNKAGVIIANPYGITCNGCGFINTSRVTLTTGESNFDRGNLSYWGYLHCRLHRMTGVLNRKTCFYRLLSTYFWR
jgi:filamentous hemagglutinin